MMIRLVPVAVLTLLALGACGQGTTSTTAAGSAPASSTSAPAPSSSPSSTTGPEGDEPVVGTGMKGGCDALHKTFLAIGGGDAEQAKRYRDAAHHLFSDVAATAATDVKVATQGATLASELELSLPAEQDAARSELATQYRAICVAGYGAPGIGGS